VSSAGAFDLQVADGALRVNCCKSIGNLVDARVKTWVSLREVA
jgi:hypothetical protein